MGQLRHGRGAGEGAGEAIGELAGRTRMEVALGGRGVRVAHRCLYAWQVDAAGDKERAVRVSEVVEPKRLEAGSVSCALEAAPQRRRVESPPEPACEHVVIRSREVTTLFQALERVGRLVGKRDLASPAALR